LGPAVGHVIGQINLRNKIIIIIIQESVATIEELYRPATRRLGERYPLSAFSLLAISREACAQRDCDTN
jgi:hypothetical protein